MRLPILTTFLAANLLISCQSKSQTGTSTGKSQDNLLLAVSWYQNSAEMTALYYQGFNIARQRLNEAVDKNEAGKSLAVVVDIDETMLDNSPFETTLIKGGNFQKGWYEWTKKASARALPGAVDFANYAKSRKVEIFYITNRDSSERKSTLQNLENVGFPYTTDDHLLTRNDMSYSTGNTSSKAGRRAKVAEKHEIILLLGDNLNDFSEIFEDRHVNNGKEAVEKNRESFGKKFIILPNPMYGAWEKPLYDYKEKLTEDKKTELLKSKLRTD